MHSHVLAQGAGVRITLLTALHFAQVRLVVHMHVHVLLAV